MTTWLTPEERPIWLSLHTVLLVLPTALDKQLQRDSKISYLEYYVLAGLSETPEHTARLSELAVLTNAELSRISHLAARLEKRGLLVRRPDPADGRYTNAILTDEGYELVKQAAPGHVAAVRELVFDGLTADDRTELRQSLQRMIDALATSEDAQTAVKYLKR